MKKKTLVILLIIPFVIALLTFVSVIALTNTVAADIAGVNILNFRDQEGFKINGEYKLEAEVMYAGNDILMKPGADTLVWELYSEDESFDDSVASIVEKDDGWYLKTGGNEGVCTLSVRNSIGTKNDSITAHIYDKGVILINPVHQASGSQIDPIRYYGEFDITYDKDYKTVTKNPAKVAFNIDVISETGNNEYTYETSNNITFDIQSETMSINHEGDSYITFNGVGSSSYLTNTYSFSVVNDGVNVYSFNDLMACTNKSPNGGEVVVLQVNLESLENTYQKNDRGEYIETYKNDNTRLFGNYNFRKKTFDFNDFIYYQEPKIDTKFIDQFIDQIGEESYDYQENIKVGVRVQKDFYANGFTLNMNDLAYPNNGTIDQTSGVFTPDREKDYFFGPLTFVSIGDLERLPIIRAFLCDNVGLLLEGNNITLNDIKVQNANNVDNMYNLRFTGTVVEVQGDNNTIKNSIIENGRTGVRAYSTDGLLIDNCLIQNAGEFLVKLGSNEVNEYDPNKNVSVSYNGNTINKSFSDFYDGGSEGDTADGILSSNIDRPSFSGSALDNFMNTLGDIQDGLDNLEGIMNADNSKNYDARITINDTYFYNSGVYSIAFETQFNGAYLYSGIPSKISKVLGALGNFGINAIAPEKIGGTSFPVELTLSGDTRFYDWKNIDDIDVGALIEENISSLASYLPEAMAGAADILKALSIDDYFPIKPILKEYAINNSLVYKEEGEDGTKYYVNRPVAWYGGGYNGSDLINDIESEEYNTFSNKIDVDFARNIMAKNYSGLGGENINDIIVSASNLLARCVVMATGAHNFNFIVNGTIENNEKPALFDEVPSYTELSNRNAR